MDRLKTYFSFPGLLDQVFASFRQAILVTDFGGRIVFVSPIVHKVLGFRPEELEGRDLSLIFTPEDLTYLYPNLLDLAKRDEAFEGEVMLLRKNGTRFFAYMLFQPCGGAKGDEAVIAVCFQDIDKRKRLEKAFDEGNYSDLVKVATGVAHEIRNPLVGVGGFVNRLYKASQDNADRDKYYEYIITSLNKLEDLVKKVEFLVSLPKPNLAKENIRKLIETVSEGYLDQIRDENIKIDLSLNVDDPFLLVDKDQILQVFSIMIENALDALSPGGTIDIRAEIRDNQCEITVTDDGKGISPDDLPFIFNPFFSTKADGAGLDLALVKRVVESHGGSIKARSNPGQGARFLIRLPLERRRPVRARRLDH